MASARNGSRREEILAAAAVLFAERGYHGVSIDDLGAAAGMTGPGIYRHFAGKEDVLAQMLLRISARLHDEGARCVTSAASAAGALEALLRSHVAFSLSQPALIVVQGRELANVPEPARRRIRRLQRLYVEEWVGVLEELLPGVPQGRLRTAAHAAIGLLNSTPYALSGPAAAAAAADGGGDVAELLVTMARAALLAAAPGPGTGTGTGTAAAGPGRLPSGRWGQCRRGQCRRGQ
jgi:AcrR family transcriptional regulator